MEVKRYRAGTIREAISKVKDILGPEAMIISTRKVKGGNENHLFEVTAVPAGGEEFHKDAALLGEVKSELMSIKDMVYLLNHSGGIIEKLVMNPEVLNLYAKLIRNGVREEYAGVFLKRTGGLKGPASAVSRNIISGAITEIKRVIKIRDPFEAKDNHPIVAAFIGTTGVGKTTTIAKIAAELMLKGKRKVGLMSIDNYRIGALDQIKTYANILGIPCFPAFNKKDLHFALKRMEGKDVVLIDTAGQSQYDKERMEELRKMMPDELSISSHLLLSVAMAESEMHKTAVNFSPLNIQSYIFTKIDESEQCGSIINQLMAHNLPISYITTGQNVPEDIEKAKPETLLNLLLNRN